MRDRLASQRVSDQGDRSEPPLVGAVYVAEVGGMAQQIDHKRQCRLRSR